MTVQQRLAPGKYRLTVSDYLRLDAEGTFGDVRTELVLGDIWVMSPAFARHARLQSRLDYALRLALIARGPGLEVLTAVSIAISEDSMPEPDLVVAEDHEEGPIPAAKVRLAIEIADSSLANDLKVKAQLYASAAIPEYWVADIEGGRLHQFWSPVADAYTNHRDLALGAEITAAAIDGLVLTLPSV